TRLRRSSEQHLVAGVERVEEAHRKNRPAASREELELAAEAAERGALPVARRVADAEPPRTTGGKPAACLIVIPAPDRRLDVWDASMDRRTDARACACPMVVVRILTPGKHDQARFAPPK